MENDTPTPQAPQPTVPKTPMNVSQGASDMKVSENKYIIADMEKQLFQVNEILKDGNLPPQKRKEYEDQQKKIQEQIDDTKSKVDVKAQDLAKDKGEEDEDIKDIFKEEDILKYMYTEWLLGGANWLFKKGYKKLDWMTQKTACASWFLVANVASGTLGGMKYAKKKLFDKIPPRDDQTTRQAAALSERARQHNAARAEETNKLLQQYKERLERIYNGKATEDDKKSPAFKEFQKLNSTEEKNKFIGEKLGIAARLASNRTIAYSLAETAVALKYSQNHMKDKNYKLPTDKEHQAEVKLMALLIARKIHSSNEPAKTIETFNKELNNAQEKLQKNLQKGKYDANGKTAKDNKYLKNFFMTLGLTANGELPSNTTTEYWTKSVYPKGSEGQKAENAIHYDDTNWLDKLQQAQEPETMQESLLRSQSNMAVLNESLNTYKQGEGALLAYKNQRKTEHAPTYSKIDAMYTKLGIATNPYHNIQGQSPLAPEHHTVHLDVTKGAYNR